MKIFRYLRLRTILSFYYSLYFNFRVLPWKQAVKLPFLVYVKPTILRNTGKIIIDAPCVSCFMIKLGKQRTPISTPREFILKNSGTIVFKGKCRLGHHMLIQVDKGGYLEFGDQTALNPGSRIVCQKKVVFKYKARTSWECQIYDTDFHPIIDMVRNKPIKMCAPIIIGEKVWIGHNVIISKGVKLANNIIVGSGSVVKKSFSTPNSIIAGNPAEMIDEGYEADFEDL
jgi:acetyltransferase-like isoleucine patch superfamily enzyme